LAIGLTCGSASPTMSRGQGPCDQWNGTYAGRLGPDDTFTGSPTKLTLTVQRDGVVWSIVGEGVPEILLSADQYRCSASRINGSFSGSHMSGRFSLMRRGRSYAFDSSDLGNGSKDEPNLLGYVPNRPISMSKIP
jgi:hypothetical protein